MQDFKPIVFLNGQSGSDITFLDTGSSNQRFRHCGPQLEMESDCISMSS
jgi:hypothetical protein